MDLHILIIYVYQYHQVDGGVYGLKDNVNDFERGNFILKKILIGVVSFVVLLTAVFFCFYGIPSSRFAAQALAQRMINASTYEFHNVESTTYNILKNHYIITLKAASNGKEVKVEVGVSKERNGLYLSPYFEILDEE